MDHDVCCFVCLFFDAYFLGREYNSFRRTSHELADDNERDQGVVNMVWLPRMQGCTL
jgi:hypothetical protein